MDPACAPFHNYGEPRSLYYPYLGIVVPERANTVRKTAMTPIYDDAVAQALDAAVKDIANLGVSPPKAKAPSSATTTTGTKMILDFLFMPSLSP